MSFLHWDYFLALVEDLEHAGRYVEISPANYGTFSLEFTRIILSAGSEIDVVAKLLYPPTVKEKKHLNIEDHRKALIAEFPQFWSTEVEVRRHGLAFVPWGAWQSAKPPDWWNSYNQIKHHRDENFAKGNLEVALTAVAGLCVMVTYLYAEELDAGKIRTDAGFLNLHRKYHYSTRMEGRDLFCPPDYEPARVVQLPGGGARHTPLKRK